MVKEQGMTAATVAMVLCAAVIAETAISAIRADVGRSLAPVAAGVVIAVSLAARRGPSWEPISTHETIAIALAGAAPFGVEPIWRVCFTVGSPYEVLLAESLRNLMLGLAGLQATPSGRRLAVVASLFLVLYGSMWTTGPALVTLLAIYALFGTWWLLAQNWRQLRLRATAASATVPRGAYLAVVAGGCLVVLALAPLATSRAVTTALQGIFPSSGGTGANDPFANGGVGDGDQIVSATEDALSFGPVESQLFLESEMPSLYDTFDDAYNEPVRNKKRKQLRAIPLAPSLTKPADRRTATAANSGREFSLVRQPRRRADNLPDGDSNALLSVLGRTPCHLRLETFNHWTGRELVHLGSYGTPQPLTASVDAQEKTWAALDGPTGAAFAVEEPHAIRVLNLRTPRIATPPQAARLHIDQMRDAGLFHRDADGGIAYAGEFVPQLTTIHVVSRPLKASATRGIALQRINAEAGDLPHAIVQLAQQWAESCQGDWERVEAICSSLRAGYRLDRQAVSVDDESDPVVDFLTRTKVGPDYLFATSAALLLRALGYETQVASGFYAHPDSWDRVARQTPITAADVHFWAEVRDASGAWIALEPSPGYELLTARLGWGEWLAWKLQASAAFLAKRPITTTVVAVGTFVLAIFRRRIALVGAAFVWNVRASRTEPRGLVLATLRLIDRKLSLARIHRPTGRSPVSWLRSCRMRSDAIAARQMLDEFLRAVDWALYSPTRGCPLEPAQLLRVCRQALRGVLGPASGRTPRGDQ